MSHTIDNYRDLDDLLQRYRDHDDSWPLPHLLITGRPGCGKTHRVCRHFRNDLPDAPAGLALDAEPARRPVPIYNGRMTPAKGYVRAWFHRDDPLVIFNDVSIGAGEWAWEQFLLQLTEVPGERTIGWHTRTPIGLNDADRAEYADILRLRSTRESGAENDAADVPRSLPHSFTCRSSYVIVANRLGLRWDGVDSRLMHAVFRPTIEAMLEELESWCDDQEVLAYVRERHELGEILHLDFRRVQQAMSWRRLGRPWQPDLAASFAGPDENLAIEDARAILDHLIDSGRAPGAEVTERDLHVRFQGLRPKSPGGDERREAALRYLVAQGYIERRPAGHRSGGRGRPCGPAIRVLRLEPAV